jgi:hypothetical protein
MIQWARNNEAARSLFAIWNNFLRLKKLRHKPLCSLRFTAALLLSSWLALGNEDAIFDQERYVPSRSMEDLGSALGHPDQTRNRRSASLQHL